MLWSTKVGFLGTLRGYVAIWDASHPTPHSPLPDGIMFCRSLLPLHNSQSSLWNVCLSMITKMMSKPESLCSELSAYVLHPQH